MPFGTEIAGDGVRFRIWAPGARAAYAHVDGRSIAMDGADDGFFSCTAHAARAGSRYAFSFDGNDLRVPDPASRFNPDDVHGPSEVVDPCGYEWRPGGWRGRPWHEAVIYELHLGTCTTAGTYAAAVERLEYLADLGVTAIELMPLADTPGRYNWGYVGVLQFAPESGYGRPEGLKGFIDAAHECGLMVLLDVVYNHFGPDGNYLNIYAPQFFTARHHTPWGNGINFDDAHSAIVRDFFVHNALYWLDEYRFDGLRLDAVHAIADDSDPDFLSELAARVAPLATERHVHLVLENDDNEAHYLRRDERGRPCAYTAQWNDDWHHALHVLLTGERRGHYEDYERPGAQLLRATVEGFAYQGETSRYRGGRARGESSAGLPPAAFVNFLQNHDQIGNRPDGKRLWQLVGPQGMLAAETLLLLLPTPIVLFMGDELHATSPFPFFCDFGDELAAAVTEGRRREFAKLARDAAEFDRLPGPNTPAAHAAAVVDWSSRAEAEHAAAFDLYRRLLGVRRDVLVPLMPAREARGTLLGERAFAAEWDLEAGAKLHAVANLASDETPCAALPAGELLAATAKLASGAARLPPWYVEWRLERR
jgi:malto-oligosyltrehalose trehalohydrolase